MQYKVFQFQLSDAEIDAINSGENEKAYAAMITVYKGKPEQLSFSQMLKFRHVATLEADSLEDVFEKTNTGPWLAIPECTMHTPKARSVSVGDVIQDDNGWWVCKAFGWAALTDTFLLSILRAKTAVGEGVAPGKE